MQWSNECPQLDVGHWKNEERGSWSACSVTCGGHMFISLNSRHLDNLRPLYPPSTPINTAKTLKYTKGDILLPWICAWCRIGKRPIIGRWPGMCPSSAVYSGPMQQDLKENCRISYLVCLTSNCCTSAVPCVSTISRPFRYSDQQRPNLISNCPPE